MKRTSGAILFGLCCAAPQVLFAQDSHDFITEYDVFVSRQRGGPVRDARESAAIERDWSNFPFQEMDEGQGGIQPRDHPFNEALYRRAVSEYERAFAAIEDFQRDTAALDAARGSIRDPLWWKHMEELARLERVQNGLGLRFHRETAAYFRRVFETMNRIDKPSLARQPRVVALKKRAYRLYVVHQTALGDFHPALKILEVYGEFEESKNEWPYYYYLSVCYDALYRQTRRDTGVSEGALREFRRRKNFYRMRAVELKFGRTSTEFEWTFDRVYREELGSPRK